MKRSKVAQRNETNERIELFENSQAFGVCLEGDYNCNFTGIFQNWTIKNSSILDISQRAVFSSKLIHEIKMVGHHARFGCNHGAIVWKRHMFTSKCKFLLLMTQESMRSKDVQCKTGE